MKVLKIMILSSVLILGLSRISNAVDMTGRLGVGFNLQTEATFSSLGENLTVPSLSVKFGASPNLSIAGLLGFSYDSWDEGGGVDGSSSVILLGAKVFYNLPRGEKQSNFYLGAGAFLFTGSRDNVGRQGGNESFFAFKIPGYFGAEFFPAGIPNVGLSFEGGIELIIGSVEDTDLFKFGTTGGIFNVGVHYYF